MNYIMNKVTFLAGGAVLTTAVFIDIILAFALLFFLLGVLLVWLILAQVHLTVAEERVAVIVDRSSERFSRFLPAGRYWLRPSEIAQAIIPLNGQTVQGESAAIQTSGGLSLTISWSIAYDLEPMRVKPEKQAKAARLLPVKSAVTIRKHMDNILQHIVGDLSIEAIYQSGSHRRLERQVRQQLTARLYEVGITIGRVMVGPITMPDKVQAALAAAHERRLQTELETAALTRLHDAVRQFSDKDMDRLLELERIHSLGQRGVTVFYEKPTEAPQLKWQVAGSR